MAQVDDALMMKLASVNITSEGLLSSLIAAHLTEVGFTLPLYADAVEFSQPLVGQIDAILHRARQHMH